MNPVLEIETDLHECAHAMNTVLANKTVVVHRWLSRLIQSLTLIYMLNAGPWSERSPENWVSHTAGPCH